MFILVLTFPTGASKHECNLTSGDFQANQENTTARGAVCDIPRRRNREHKIVHTHTPTCTRSYKHLHTRDVFLEGSYSAAHGQDFKVTPFISCG